MDNKSLSHTKWKCQYHIVFIPKYRKKILYGRVKNDVREIISTLCKYKDVDIIAGAVVNVPLFVDMNDVIKIDTRTGEYLSRV